MQAHGTNPDRHIGWHGQVEANGLFPFRYHPMTLRLYVQTNNSILWTESGMGKVLKIFRTLTVEGMTACGVAKGIGDVRYNCPEFAITEGHRGKEGEKA